MPESAPDSDTATTEPTEPTASTTNRRRWLRAVLSIAVIAIIAWLIVAGLQVRSASKSASRGKALLAEFREESGGSLSGLKPLTSTPDLTKVDKAAVSFSDTSKRLDSPVVRPLRLVPVLGRQLGVVQTLSESSETLLKSLMSTFDEVQQILDDVKSLPSSEKVEARLSAAVELQTSLEGLSAKVESLDSGDHEGLMASVGEARDDFIRNRSELVDSLDRAIAAVKGIHAFLAGPNTYVVLAANNAEMRAGSGMFLQAGSMSIDNGRFSMGDLKSTGDMVLDQPATEFDPELQALWGDFRPTAEWRNINLTARFDESGRIATEMWKASGNPPAQGALAVDILAIKRLLKVVGPVTVTRADGSDVELNYDNVTGYLLLQQYKDLITDTTAEGQEERRSHLGVVAKAIFESFNSGEVGFADLLDALVDVGRGRHLMAWSSDPVQQKAWRELGLSGELPGDGIMFSLINRGANKLDQFVTTTAQLQSKRSGELTHMSLAFTMDNTTPEGLPAFVAGGSPLSGVSAGDYLGYAALNVPLSAGNFTVDGGDLLATAIDGKTRVLIVRVVIPMGQSVSLTFNLDLPSSVKSVELLPSARIPRVQWTDGNESWEDGAPRTIPLG